jgi:hypothetical protein
MVFLSKPFVGLAAKGGCIQHNIQCPWGLLISRLNFYHPIPAHVVPAFVFSHVTAALV